MKLLSARRLWGIGLAVAVAAFLVPMSLAAFPSVQSSSGSSVATQASDTFTIVDTLGAATPSTTFAKITGSSLGFWHIQFFFFVGPKFTLTEETEITEIGGFIDVFEGTLPVVVQIRPTDANGFPDLTSVLATFVLSNDNDPSLISYEFATPNLTLGAGTYWALFALPDGGEASLLINFFSATGVEYQSGSTTMGFVRPFEGQSGLTLLPRGAVRILGRVTTPTCNGKPATIVGPSGDSTVTGTPGADVIVDLSGNNKIRAAGGSDTICTGPGNDAINGGGGNDWVDAGDGRNSAEGNAGHDRLITGSGSDELEGNGGNDTLTGGTGADRFRGGDGTDTATDFTPAEGDTKTSVEVF